MLGYESIEGVPVTFNKWLLTDKLRGAWKYNGTLITDWDNVGRSVWEQKVKPDYVHAAADAVKAGNDLVMTTPGFYDGAHRGRAPPGLLDESLIDEAVAQLLAPKLRLGLFEDPRLPDEKRIKAVIGSRGSPPREPRARSRGRCPAAQRRRTAVRRGAGRSDPRLR